MRTLYLVGIHWKVVFTFSATSEGTWRFSRLSPFQRAKDLEKFVIVYRREEQSGTWVIQDQTAGAKGEVVGKPGDIEDGQDPTRPPLGSWTVWHGSFTLTNRKPVCKSLEQDCPFPIEVPFASIHYSEDGSIARLEVKMHSEPIGDEVLEQVLQKFRTVVVNLAQRPEAVLFIRADARNSAVPALHHVRRFLSFVQQHGTEFVLIGRGTAIVLRPRGILGHALLSVLRFVQRFFPSPWPESTVSTMEEAEEFLVRLTADAKAELAAQEVAEAEFELPEAQEAASFAAEDASAAADLATPAAPAVQPAPAPAPATTTAPPRAAPTGAAPTPARPARRQARASARTPSRGRGTPRPRRPPTPPAALLMQGR
mmetsp:Transcript_82537/g.250305  ORF Transcript_82537/g.250305 Transcript_82537/m.250305 type:complete len:369 (+) Transcript_82537:96-1202(+)